MGSPMIPNPINPSASFAMLDLLRWEDTVAEAKRRVNVQTGRCALLDVDRLQGIGLRPMASEQADKNDLSDLEQQLTTLQTELHSVKVSLRFLHADMNQRLEVLLNEIASLRDVVDPDSGFKH